MKGNEMLSLFWCGFSVIQVKASENDMIREQKVKRSFKQHKWIKLMQY